jgi:hypothetical protein
VQSGALDSSTSVDIFVLNNIIVDQLGALVGPADSITNSGYVMVHATILIRLPERINISSFHPITECAEKQANDTVENITAKCRPNVANRTRVKLGFTWMGDRRRPPYRSHSQARRQASDRQSAGFHY